ncbi:MAG TPA: sigma-70 family RNA polymerase sigma factor [Acidisarcina sp.]
MEDKHSQTGNANSHEKLPEVSRLLDPVQLASVQLAERCRRGDAVAWAELVQSHHRLVYKLCYNFTRSSPDAEDLTQEVFIKIYANLNSFNPERGDLGGWITAVTRNQLVDYFRRTRIQRSTDSLDAGWDEQGAQPPSHRLRDRRATPHEYAEAGEVRTILRRAIAHLSPEMREVVSLRYFRGMEYKTIANFLKIPEGTVKSRINRGHTELARTLGSSYSALGYV